MAAPSREQRPLILVRPDGYIAWASGEADPDRRDASIREALTRWCGAPAAVAWSGRSQPGSQPLRRDGSLRRSDRAARRPSRRSCSLSSPSVRSMASHGRRLPHGWPAWMSCIIPKRKSCAPASVTLSPPATRGDTTALSPGRVIRATSALRVLPASYTLGTQGARRVARVSVLQRGRLGRPVRRGLALSRRLGAWERSSRVQSWFASEHPTGRRTEGDASQRSRRGGRPADCRPY